MKTVVVLGATPKTDRFAWRALLMLKQHGHRVIPLNPAFHKIAGEHCFSRISEIKEPIDTVAMYVSAERSDPLIKEIIAAKPLRIIFNPGAENEQLAAQAEAKGIEVVEGCTLVMLQSGTF